MHRKPSIWLPKTGLIREHHDYGIWATDAPPIYHVAALLPAIGALVADDAILMIDDTPYPLNVWTMLVGRSTQDRKTTAASMAIRYVQRLYEHRVFSPYGSPEGILRTLVEAPCACLYAPEGGNLFDQLNASYWRHARGMFMQLYDYNEKYTRKLSNEVMTIENPRLSMLVACAKSILAHSTIESDWHGGLMARFLMVSGAPLSFQTKYRRSERVEQRLTDLARNIYKTQWGPMLATTGACQVFDKFSYDVHIAIDKYPEIVQPAIARLPDMAKRIAALYTLALHAENPPPVGHVTLVDSESASHAVALCAVSCEETLLKTGAEIGGRTLIGTARLENIVREAGVHGIARSELLRRTGLTAAQMTQAVAILESEGTISAMRQGRREGPGRPKTIYVHASAEADVTHKKAATGGRLRFEIDDDLIIDMTDAQVDPGDDGDTLLN